MRVKFEWTFPDTVIFLPHSYLVIAVWLFLLSASWKICLPKIKQVLNTKIKEEVLECYWRSRASLCDQEITLQYFFYTKKL